MQSEPKCKSNRGVVGIKWLLLAMALLFGVVGWRVGLELMQARLDRQLIAAVHRKDQAAVVALLRRGANSSARDLPQPASLFDYLKHLFQQSPRIHAADFMPALMIALRNDDLPCAIALTDANADTNAMDRGRITPLVCLLTNSDAEDDTEDSLSAWERNFRYLVDRLLDRGADPNARDRDGNPLLVIAVQKSDASAVTGRAFQAIVGTLLRKGADPNARDTEGKTALLWSAWVGLAQEKTASFPEVMRLLLEKGANPRPSRNAGWSILNWAAYFGDVKLARTLLAKGLTVNTPDENGRTALHTAIAEQQADCVRFLLKRGANVNRADDYGMTPLMFAVQNDDAETCRLLLQHGANRKAREKGHKRTAERLARYLHAERCLTLFQTGKIVPPVARPTRIPNRVPVDANRWLVAQHSPQGKYVYLLYLMHRDGRQTLVNTLDSGRPLVIHIFRDGDGTRVAFVSGDEQGGGAALYRLEGMQAKVVWEGGSRYGSEFRPLKQGGCIVWTWRPAFQMISADDPLANDNMCLPFLYRNGKTTELEGIYFPGCLKQM